MNVNNIANQCNYIPSSVCVDGQKGEFCAGRNYSFRPPYYESIISHLLNQSEVNSEPDTSSLLPSSQKTEHTSSREAISMSPLPVYGFSNTSQFHNEHLQAKRARVENIIQGMSIMPNSIVSGILEEEDQHDFEKVKESYRQNKRKQKLPQQQSFPGISLARPPRSSISAEEFLQLKKQLHALQHQLKQLRERFLQHYEEEDSGPSQESIQRTMGLLKVYDPKLDTNGQVACCDQRKDYLWKSTSKIRGLVLPEKEDTGIQNLEERTLSEILKQELIQVITHAVDSVLKKFTRCITSQLIKWFSNFREFYYIQMEKFARQALLEGITELNDLIVTRDSELFRILNVHYNKGNDFEVPDGFLDVASLTLQEFFSAVRAGRDLDPSWKKPIYKIISKLDTEIPDVFKSSNCHKEFTQG
ncbi:prospero homeobox protein 2 [Candoia aspera]|uniref:prospero homeobox protein 2 n=1 Tax=Candoia aspera TaxID=51853 RepID=UPI002FD80539